MKIKLMAVTDNQHSMENLMSIILKIHEYVDYIQIREKSRTANEVYTLGKRLIDEGVAKEKLIINDRIDVATLLNIKNVHLPGNGLPVEQVKKLNSQYFAGVSVHSQEEAQIAQKNKADYVLYGHCFQTNSKKGKPPIELQSIKKIKKQLSIPIFVIGGITEDRVEQLADLGADGVAIMSAIFSSSNPLESVKKLNERCWRL
ncbi:thiamine phosphate synthase [Niallia nealsonii]|uniref:thiamine phosphate synthase n=1 Tax=Niallia nealsonii TaxID=115979 RepID=UPI001F38A867|nr:thiamine phosphate synthase [Niallia nealsonii]